jgi:hypothetical protein
MNSKARPEISDRAMAQPRRTATCPHGAMGSVGSKTKGGVLGQPALRSPDRGRGSMELGGPVSWRAASSFQNCSRAMNQDGTALSQRDRAHLSWEWAQSGGPRRAATRCAEFGSSWRVASSFQNRTRTMNQDGQVGRDLRARRYGNTAPSERSPYRGNSNGSWEGLRHPAFQLTQGQSLLSGPLGFRLGGRYRGGG